VLSNHSREGVANPLYRDAEKARRHKASCAKVKGDHLAVTILLEVTRVDIARAKSKTAARVGYYVDPPRVLHYFKDLSWLWVI
jgi:hypothetical protein